MKPYQAKRDEWENGTNSLQERGIRTDYGLFPASPLYNERFTRFGATATESQSVVEELKANEALDEDNFLLLSPTELSAVIADQPENWPNFLSIGNQFGIKKLKTELKQTYADHGAFDDWTHRMIDFGWSKSMTFIKEELKQMWGLLSKHFIPIAIISFSTLLILVSREKVMMQPPFRIEGFAIYPSIGSFFGESPHSFWNTHHATQSQKDGTWPW